ncbi:hypothetical protein Gotur_025418, partial [Gossypium turneri]
MASIWRYLIPYIQTPFSSIIQLLILIVIRLVNEGDSLGGCIQLRSDDGASESGCITLITANFTSYTVYMTAMYPDSKRCASAFIFSLYSSSTGYSLPSGINNRSSHVPAVLSWNSTYCGEG